MSIYKSLLKEFIVRWGVGFGYLSTSNRWQKTQIHQLHDMWKSNLNSQKTYVNFWEVYILRALLASIINPDVKISTFFSLHTKNHHTHTSELSSPFTTDGEALLELCLSLPSVPVFIKCLCVLLRCSRIPSSLRQLFISLAFSPSSTSSPVSSPLPSVHAITQSCLTLCDPVDSRLLCPWDSPDKNTGVGCHVLLLGLFPMWESNPGLLYLLYWQGGSWPGILSPLPLLWFLLPPPSHLYSREKQQTPPLGTCRADLPW